MSGVRQSNNVMPKQKTWWEKNGFDLPFRQRNKSWSRSLESKTENQHLSPAQGATYMKAKKHCKRMEIMATALVWVNWPKKSTFTSFCGVFYVSPKKRNADAFRHF
jgi:hypothetical protein